MSVSSKRRGLGKGLDALLAASLDGDVIEDVARPNILRELPISQISPGPFQPRNTIDPAGIERLAASIRQQGVIQPIVVREKGDRYEILAGERRWRASQLAGLDRIPAVVRDVPDDMAMAIALIENIQRENLNPVEEARALKRLADELQLTHLQVAEMLGKSRASITNLLRLLSLSPDVLLLVEKGELEMGHARALLSLQGSLQTQVAKAIVKRAMSVRETERVVARLQEGLAEGGIPRISDPNIRRLEQDLADKLGAPVAIRHSPKGKGTLVIHYGSTEELDGILNHIR
jgi:ParB family chromosome partitioning protein